MTSTFLFLIVFSFSNFSSINFWGRKFWNEITTKLNRQQPKHLAFSIGYYGFLFCPFRALWHRFLFILSFVWNFEYRFLFTAHFVLSLAHILPFLVLSGLSFPFFLSFLRFLPRFLVLFTVLTLFPFLFALLSSLLFSLPLLFVLILLSHTIYFFTPSLFLSYNGYSRKRIANNLKTSERVPPLDMNRVVGDTLVIDTLLAT